MLIDFKDVSTVRKSVGVEIPAEEVRAELAKVTDEFARQARLPGFRKGKVPRHLVRSKFLKDIDSEVLDRLLPKFFRQAVNEKKLDAVGQPALTRVDPVKEGEPLRFDAEFEVRPEIDLKDFRGLDITEKPTDVSDAEVDAAVERLRGHGSSFRNITDRPSAEGDYLVIDIVSQSEEEGAEARRSENYRMHLGEDAPLPELREALIGKQPGDEATVEKRWEDDAPNEDVRGKTVRYSMTVKEVQVLELPELNDELAKSSGMAETLDELRAKIREDIGRHKEQEERASKRQQAGKHLVEMHAFEVPEAMVDEETAKALREYARYLASQGIEVEKAQIDWEKLRDEFREEAVKRVRLQLVLENIASREGIEVSTDDVDNEIRREVPPQQFAAVRRNLLEDGSYERIRSQIRQERALDAVIAAGNISKK